MPKESYNTQPVQKVSTIMYRVQLCAILCVLLTSCLSADAVERVANPPVIQALVPGLTIRELPVNLTNINNIIYAPDGRLFAAGYDGRVHLLKDTDGDGLEDSVTTFYDKVSADFPLGIAFVHDCLLVLRRHELIAHIDVNRDGIPDKEEIAATGWRDEELSKNPLYLQRRVDDAIGLAVAPDGTIYTSTGTPNYNNGYMLNKEGKAEYDLTKRRGVVLRIPPGGKPEIVATGVRFLVSMQFHKNGDLFATDQEGATWMPNGNPFDELLHIQEGRHYGFPPRHPAHLPNVIDEPSVFDYAPQHESTCGFRFNSALDGWKTFGPPAWEDCAFVAGQSRGKLFRTQVVKTASGYVAQNQLIACIGMLPADVAFSPQGDLVVACHGGAPDWGSGPSGKGKLFKISYKKETPQPVAIWAAGPRETRIEFDNALDKETQAAVVNAITMQGGKYISAGDDFETLRPGYAVVKDIQQKKPRIEVPVRSAKVLNDGRTLLVESVERKDALNYVLRIPWTKSPDIAASVAQHPVVELACDLSGLEANWQSQDGKTSWNGWLPHADLAVAAEMTRGSAEHARLWELLKTPGTLRLKGQLDLWQMLHPAIQPGSKLDYQPATEAVTLTFSASGALTLGSGAPAIVSRASDRMSTLQVNAEKRWTPFELSVSTDAQPPVLTVSFRTNEDPRERALMRRRFLLPWANALDGADEVRTIPEIAGGDWNAGKALFFNKAPGCATCHTKDGDGGKVAPDLSNLIHRDFESVMKDIRQPSAAINPDYLQYMVKLDDGKVLNGIVVAANDSEIRLGDASGQSTPIPRASIRSMVAVKQSLMPEALLDALTPQQVKDLMTYLLSEAPKAKPK